VIVDGKTYFVGSDVAKALGYKNPSEAIIRHCKSDGVVIHEVIDSIGRKQDAKFISERTYDFFFKQQKESHKNL
jgi:prophage antirepressor-like protein